MLCWQAAMGGEHISCRDKSSGGRPAQGSGRSTRPGEAKEACIAGVTACKLFPCAHNRTLVFWTTELTIAAL